MGCMRAQAASAPPHRSRTPPRRRPGPRPRARPRSRPAPPPARAGTPRGPARPPAGRIGPGPDRAAGPGRGRSGRSGARPPRVPQGGSRTCRRRRRRAGRIVRRGWAGPWGEYAARQCHAAVRSNLLEGAAAAPTRRRWRTLRPRTHTSGVVRRPAARGWSGTPAVIVAGAGEARGRVGVGTVGRVACNVLAPAGNAVASSGVSVKAADDSFIRVKQEAYTTARSHTNPPQPRGKTVKTRMLTWQEHSRNRTDSDLS